MNNLWASRLADVVEKHEQIEETEIKRFFQQATKQDRAAMKKLCDNNLEFRVVNQQFNRARATIRQQKIEIGELKYYLDNGREDFKTKELINKVREQDKLIEDLQYRAKKLKKNNEVQYKSYIRDIQDSSEIAQRREVAANADWLPSLKLKHKELTKLRDRYLQSDKTLKIAIDKERATE